MKELDFTCPKCGKTRRLKGTGSSRTLECGAWNCRGSEPVPADLKLTIKQMAEAMAYESLFNNSDDQRKEQAKARRAASTVRSFAHTGYLSDSESALLMDAAEVLERVGTAAEQAKKELKRQEKAEELRRAGREKEARSVLFPRLELTAQYTESVPLLLALLSTEYNRGTFHSEDRLERDILQELERLDPTLRGSRESAVKYELNNYWRYVTDDALSTISYRPEPDAATMARELIEEVENAIADPALQERAARLVERINAAVIQERLEKTNPKAGQ